MADIAVVFHWPPQAMAELYIDELIAWRDRARVRNDSGE